jgi:pimeloyl-ACP methyl ester carboxylesterase
MSDRRPLGTLAVGILVVALVACAPAGPPSVAGDSPTAPPSGDTPSPTAAPASTRPSPTSTRSPAPYEEVELIADDGRRLRGRLWSTAPVGVVLAHGFSQHTGQDDWNAFAPYLRDQGYGVMTFDFSGFCDIGGCSEGPLQLAENWRDVAVAVEYLRSRGSEQIFIIAASMGGLAAFRAADEADLDFAGIVSLSTPQFPSRYYNGEPPENDVTPERLQRIEAPKLFIAGADDVQLPREAPMKAGIDSVRFADDAQSMFDAAPEPKQIELVDSALHSSELVTIADPKIVQRARQIIVAFIEEHA